MHKSLLLLLFISLVASFAAFAAAADDQVSHLPLQSVEAPRFHMAALKRSHIKHRKHRGRGGQVRRRRKKKQKHHQNSHGLLQYCLGKPPCFTFANMIVSPIYWGQAWQDPTYQSDIISSNEELYSHLTGTPYMSVLSQYLDAPPVISYNRAYFNYSTSFSSFNFHTIAHRMAEMACSVAQINGLDSSNYYFPIYVDYNRGIANFCGFHGTSRCEVSGKTIHLNYAFFFDVRNDADCSVGLHTFGRSQGAANLANVGIHELVETMTDPGGHGWFTKGLHGEEIADLCEQYLSTIQLSDGSYWEVQGIYSNAARMCVWYP